jgi:hypothetical protein
MRTIITEIILLLAIPLAAMSASAEDFHFYTVMADNSVIPIEFSSFGGDWNGHAPVYRNRSVQAFNYCWWSNDGEYFSCAPARDASRAVVYRRADRPVKTNQEAMALLGEIPISETGALQDYYICEQGCARGYPGYLFNIGDSGC